MKWQGKALCLVAGLLWAAPCSAGTVTVSGHLNDAGNTALIGSAAWDDATTPPPAGFLDDYEIANNVALYVLTYASPTAVTFTSLGFGAGGVDPYFSLFAGGDGTATWIGSNYVQAFSTGGDFVLPFMLGPGTYTAALGVFANMSYAENLGSGSLGDGFVGLGVPDYLGDGYYELEISTPEPEVPEPATLWLTLAAVSAICARSFHRQRPGHAHPVS